MKKIYLNNAASGWPKAEGVLESVSQSLQTPPYHPGRVASKENDFLNECRLGIASLVEIEDSSRIILTNHATHALNLAIQGIGLNNQSHVITTVTEHNSVLRPLQHIKQRCPDLQITVIGLDSSGSIDEEAFTRSLTCNPSLVVINHSSNVTGRINNVANFFHKAQKAGAITLLDAAQTFGCIPVPAEKLHADMIAFTGHKGLHGPTGTGGLYVRHGLDLEQIYVGGTGVRSDLMLHPTDMPIRLEAGTPNFQGFSGLAASLKWNKNHGDEFSQKANRHANTLRSRLAEIPKVTLFDSQNNCERTAVVSFRIQGWEVEELGYVLAESFDIICRSGLHCAPLIHNSIQSAPEGTIRFSPSGFTTDEEIEKSIQAVVKIAS